MRPSYVVIDGNSMISIPKTVSTAVRHAVEILAGIMKRYWEHHLMGLSKKNHWALARRKNEYSSSETDLGNW